VGVWGCRQFLNVIEDDEWLALQCDEYLQDFLASYYVLSLLSYFHLFALSFYKVLLKGT
jgi:hypothetical protein